MKNRVLIEISGREFALITDETELYMKTLAAEVNKMINESSYKNIRTSKNDAALLICLDLCDKKNKLSDANDNMRSQIAAYIEEIDKLKKQLELSERQLAIMSSINKSKNNKNNMIDDIDESDSEIENETESDAELENEPQENQSEYFEDEVQEEYADTDTADNSDDSIQERYKPENKIKPKSAETKTKSSASPYGSYLFGKSAYKKNPESNNINDGRNGTDSENGEENGDNEKYEKKREKDFESLKERFNRLQKDMSRQ